MPFDTSMYRNQPVNVLDVIGGYQNIGLRNQQKQQNALELQKYQQAIQDRERGLQDEMAIRNAMAGLGPDATTDQVVSALRPLGPKGWEKADIYAKNAAERDKAKAALKEQEVKAQEQATRKQVENLKVFNYFMNAVGADPRPEVAAAAIGEIEKRTGEKFPLGEQLMMHAKDPQKLGEVATKWALEAEKRLPKEYQGSTGQFDIKGMRDPVTGQEVGSPLVFQQSMTPAQKAKAEHDAEMARLRGLEVSGQNRAPKPVDIVDPANPNQMIKVDANIWNPQTRQGIIGVAGKEPGAALRENKVQQGQQQAADIIDSIRAAYQTLDTNEAIPSTKRNAASNLASALAATSFGQMLGRATGTENQVERDVVNSSRLQLLNAIKQSTGMSAQQLNSNVELQLWLKAVTDPGQSYEAVDRILGNIEKFIASGGKYSERKSSGAVDQQNKPSAPSKPTVLRFDAQGNPIK